MAVAPPPRPFVAAVKPAFVVHSAGFMNQWGFPRPEVVARYQGRGSGSGEAGAIPDRAGDAGLRIPGRAGAGPWYRRGGPWWQPQVWGGSEDPVSLPGKGRPSFVTRVVAIAPAALGVAQGLARIAVISLLTAIHATRNLTRELDRLQAPARLCRIVLGLVGGIIGMLGYAAVDTTFVYSIKPLIDQGSTATTAACSSGCPSSSSASWLCAAAPPFSNY